MPRNVKEEAKNWRLTKNNNKHIMIVDDEEGVLTRLKHILEQGGRYILDAFASPHAALERFRQSPAEYDIVISAAKMQGMTGFELARAVRSARPQVRIILMTPFEIDSWEFGKVMPSTKVDAFITKPVSTAALCSIVASEKRGRNSSSGSSGSNSNKHRYRYYHQQQQAYRSSGCWGDGDDKMGGSNRIMQATTVN